MRRPSSLGRAALIVLFAVSIQRCAEPPDPITVDDGMIVVENRTSTEWRNVRVTVNHHFNGGAGVLAPGARLNAPLSQFQTGFGHRFDRARMSVFRVDVTATGADGKPVTLRWGQ